METALLRYANTVGADAGKLSARGVLVGGELRSAQAQAAGPVCFVFTGALRTNLPIPGRSVRNAGTAAQLVGAPAKQWSPMPQTLLFTSHGT